MMASELAGIVQLNRIESPVSRLCLCILTLASQDVRMVSSCQGEHLFLQTFSFG